MSLLKLICILFVLPFCTSEIQAASWSATPLQLTSTGTNSIPQISASGAGNAVAVWLENGNTVNASIYSNGSWQTVQAISGSSDTLTTPLVSMYVVGRAVAVWRDETTNTIESAVYNGSTWASASTSFTNVDSAPTLSMNNTGSVILGYSDSSQNAWAAFFSSGTWGAPEELSTATVVSGGAVIVAINPGGGASALWENTSGGIDAASYYATGEFWGTPTVISSGSTNSNPAIGMDNLGNTLAIWLSGTSPKTLETAKFDGTSWTSPASLDSTVNGTYQPVIAVAPSGLATAVWVENSSDDILTANYTSSAWGSSQTIYTTSGAATNIQPQVAIASSGNSYAIWAINIGSEHLILSSTFTEDAWGAAQTLASVSATVDQEQIAVSPNNAVFSIWQTNSNIFTSTLSLTPTAPGSLSGSVLQNKFMGQTDRIHQLVWTPASDDTITSYVITRNGALLTSISSLGPYSYRDHNRSKSSPDVYTVSSINGGGVASSSLTITLQ